MGTMLSLCLTYSIFGTKYTRRNQFPEISLTCVHELRLSSFLFRSGSVSCAILANILFYFTCCFLNNLNFLVVSYRARGRASGGASDDDDGGTSGRASASGGAIVPRTRRRTNNSR